MGTAMVMAMATVIAVTDTEAGMEVDTVTALQSWSPPLRSTDIPLLAGMDTAAVAHEQDMDMVATDMDDQALVSPLLVSASMSGNASHHS